MRAVLLVLFLGAAAWGQKTEEFTFYTYPSGAKVYAHWAANPLDLNNQGTVRAQKSFVGISGSPLRMIPPPTRSGERFYAVVTLELEGHETREIDLGQDFLSLHRWPRDGKIDLRPLSLNVALRDAVKEYPLPVAAGLALLAAMTGALVIQRRKLGKARQWKKQLDSLLAGADRTDTLIGRKVGHYIIVDRLGAGGMAVVYRGVPEGTLDASRSVAIKVIAPEAAQDVEFKGRFGREVKAYQKLSHPNIVRLIEWGDEDPIYLAMELVDGPTLRQRVVAGGLPAEEAVELLYSMVTALAYAHKQGIVHRDLKPDNVMLAGHKLVKIMDFGLARSRDVSRQLTASGTALGTPDYMSPEQINGVTTPAADQYALGIMAFELLSGRLPFEGDTMSVLFQHIMQPAPPLSQFVPGVAPALEAIVMRMIATAEGDRFANLAEVAGELTKLYPELGKRRKPGDDPFAAGSFDSLG